MLDKVDCLNKDIIIYSRCVHKLEREKRKRKRKREDLEEKLNQIHIQRREKEGKKRSYDTTESKGTKRFFSFASIATTILTNSLSYIC